MRYRPITHCGFTLIELMIVIAITGMILSFGMTLNVNTIQGDTFLSERATVVSILERARSRAMANLFDTNHGVCYIQPNYIIFKGDSCTNTDSELIPANTNIISNSLNTFPEKIIFERLTGRTTEATIHITDGAKEADIIINNEGTINW